MNTYEGMFLFDTTFAHDFAKVEREVGRLMERAGAEILMCRKWDERKLAYEIKGQKRGCYVLAFFKADPDKIAGIERDVKLSEPVLRVLVLRADYMTPEDMEKAYPSRPGAAAAPPPPDRAGGAPKSDAAATPKSDAETTPESDSAATPKAKPEPAAVPAGDTAQEAATGEAAARSEPVAETQPVEEPAVSTAVEPPSEVAADQNE